MKNFQQLIAALKENSKANYKGILSQAKLSSDELLPYLNYSPACYTRNLVHRSAEFELLVLCWGRGQVTPIHDHAGSDCWMLGLNGEVEELQYSLLREEGAQCRVKVAGATPAQSGNVCFINDTINLHSIRNTYPGPSATLHLYSPPIATCLYFHETLCEMKPRHLKNYSEFGRILA